MTYPEYQLRGSSPRRALRGVVAITLACAAANILNAQANSPTPEGTGIATWGNNNEGELGNGTVNRGPHYSTNRGSNVPVLVDTSGVLHGKTIIAIAGEAGHRLALCSDGTLAAWGRNYYGQLGNGESGRDVYSATPVLVNTRPMKGKKIIAIAAGTETSLALSEDGRVFQWGADVVLRGTFAGKPHPTPEPVDTGALKERKAVAIVAGYESRLALCSDGALVAWGTNRLGVLGNGVSIAGSEGKSYPPVVINDKWPLQGKSSPRSSQMNPLVLPCVPMALFSSGEPWMPPRIRGS